MALDLGARLWRRDSERDVAREYLDVQGELVFEAEFEKGGFGMNPLGRKAAFPETPESPPSPLPSETSGHLRTHLYHHAQVWCKLVLTELRVLASPPGSRLEALRGDRNGQHSIRINDQWRICFVWRDGHCYDVEIADYH